MEEAALRIVIAGHVDHGKSTLVGRLLYDTGSLAPDRVEEIRKASESLGARMEFAYVMDHLEEERRKGITIDIAHTFFRTARRRYVIIDAPGHKEFLKNMITGTSQAEAAIVLVDVTQGIMEQTRRHISILGLLGIRQFAVLVNKMDAAAYSEAAFEALRDAMLDLCANTWVKPAHVIPVCASLGANVAARRPELSWYAGPTVVEALDGFSPARLEDKALRLPVQDIYGAGGDKVAVGRVEAGVLMTGAQVKVLPEGRTARVASIRKFNEEGIKTASAGECVGVTLDAGGLCRGQVITGGAQPRVSDRLRASVFWMTDSGYSRGAPLVWKSATQEAVAVIEKIYRRYDPASIEVVETDAVAINGADMAEVEIRLDRPVVTDPFTEIQETGRFVLELSGEPVAGGIVHGADCAQPPL